MDVKDHKNKVRLKRFAANKKTAVQFFNPKVIKRTYEDFELASGHLGKLSNLIDYLISYDSEGKVFLISHFNDKDELESSMFNYLNLQKEK